MYKFVFTMAFIAPTNILVNRYIDIESMLNITNLFRNSSRCRQTQFTTRSNLKKPQIIPISTTGKKIIFTRLL